MFHNLHPDVEQGGIRVFEIPVGGAVLDPVGRSTARIQVVLLLPRGEVVGLDSDEDVLHRPMPPLGG